MEYLALYKSVRVPMGQGILAEALMAAKESEVPENVGKRFTNPKILLLVKFLMELQKTIGKKPFFMSCRALARILGIDHKTAAKWLKALGVMGILKVVDEFDFEQRKARSYRYLLPLDDSIEEEDLLESGDETRLLPEHDAA